MNKKENLEKLLQAFRHYYNVTQSGVTEPFAAEAEFHSHDEQYFISKSAKLFESESNEYVFFADEQDLSLDRLTELDAIAWQEGLNRVVLKEGHKCSDVSLIILAERIHEDAKKQLRKISHYKSYAFTLKGWSHYRLIALEQTTGAILHNRLGESLKELLYNTQSHAAV